MEAEEQSATCTTCGKETEGYKCEMCGIEASSQSAPHTCGDEHCKPKCKECKNTDTSCTC